LENRDSIVLCLDPYFAFSFTPLSFTKAPVNANFRDWGFIALSKNIQDLDFQVWIRVLR